MESTITEKITILIADDEPDILVIMELILKSQGYEVIKGTNGIEALELASEHLPNLILLDIMMPEMDGWEVLRLLKTDPRTSGIPVAMVSAREGSRPKITSMQEGALDYVTKPFDTMELLNKVKELLNK